jgi:hypothetical protein
MYLSMEGSFIRTAARPSETRRCEDNVWEQTIVPTMQVLRQCPFVVLVYTRLKASKAVVIGEGVRLVTVRVTLGLTVSQSVCLGVEPHLGLMTRYYV